MKNHTIAFIGAGNMAKAIISGMLRADQAAINIIAVNRSMNKNIELEHDFGIRTMQNAALAIKQANVVILGVKPQNMQELFESLPSVDWRDKLVISLAAGVTTARLQELAGHPLKLIRVMPNTPALVGEGMSGLYADTSVLEQDKHFTEQLLQSVGKTCWVDTEDEINGIIAAAGSAPAYFFLFMEAMQLEAQRQGFSEQQARDLVQQSALGAAKLAGEKRDISFTELREQVTSKGGTTAEAIQVFQQANLSTVVATAMQAAVKRAKEMELLF